MRPISRLDVKGHNLIKGVQLEGLRVVGAPGDYARRYYKTVLMKFDYGLCCEFVWS